MKIPMISVIMLVCNAGEFLRETINSLLAQTFGDFEVICIDGGCTDNSVAILEETAQKDNRFKFFHHENTGAGTVRNYGLSKASGEYVVFLDSGDLASPTLLEKLHNAAITRNTDIAVCNFGRIQPNGKITRHEGVHAQWIPAGLVTFSYRDCPDYILRVLDSAAGNKMYRSAFLREQKLKFDELHSSYDLAFSAVSAAAAQRIAFIDDVLVQYRDGKLGSVSSGQKLDDVKAAVISAVRQVNMLPYSEQLHNAMLSFVVGNFITTLLTGIEDFSVPEVEAFYRMAHEIFNREEFSAVDARTLRNPKQYREFCTVQKHDYETIRKLVGRRIIVSLTTYPRRIGTLGPVLESIYAQTRKADEMVLWLAEEQFPGREADIPEDLLALVAEKRLTIRWCNDLKPHKKYFYALQEYTDDLVVTVDDDLLYSKDMLDALFRSYLLYPEAVSTVRAHLIMISENHEIMPYHTWIQETDSCIYEPSMQLVATGGAGVLYPPNLLRKELFDQEAIQAYCPLADDLWLKCMQLVSDVPVVVARPHEQLRYLPDTQEEALHMVNVRQNQNDVQLANISKWLDEKYEKDILIKKLTVENTGVKIMGMEAVSRHIDEERKALRRYLLQAENKISQCNEQLREAEIKQRQTEKEKRRVEERLKQTENKLHRAEADKRELRARMPIGVQFKELGDFLREQNPRGASWYVKYFIYLLAYIPEKLLILMMFYLKNGAKETIRLFLNKFRGR